MNYEETVVHFTNNLETRVAVLEMSVMNINRMLSRIEQEIQQTRRVLKMSALLISIVIIVIATMMVFVLKG